MRLWLACKAFWNALKNPRKTEASLPEKIEQLKTADISHLRLLAYLQQSGRLIDFFMEDIDTFSDDQVGAAARQVHQDCRKALEDLVAIRPILEESEGANYRVPKGYQPSCYKIVGKVKGEAPYTGTVRHKGWKAHKLSLPKQAGASSAEIIAPAEIEME